VLSNEHTNLLLHLQKLNSTGKGTACILELHTEVEKVFTIHTSSLAPDLVVWGRGNHIKVNLELYLELDIHDFCEVK